MDGLLQVAMLLAAGAGIEETLEVIVRLLLESNDHTRASLALWDPESKVLTMAVSLGTAPVPPGTALPYDRASSDLQEAIDTGHIVVADYDADAEPGRLVSEFASHLSLIAPIIYDEQLLGVLSVDDPGERREFTPEERGFIAGLVAQAAAAIKLARLLDAEREAAKLGAALAEVDAVVHSSLDVESITAQALAAGARAIGAETGAVIGTDRGGWLTWQSYNFEPSVVGVRLTDEENPHGVAAVTTGATVAIDDAYSDPRVNNEFMRGYGLRSVIVAPIFLAGQTGCRALLQLQHCSSSLHARRDRVRRLRGDIDVGRAAERREVRRRASASHASRDGQRHAGGRGVTLAVGRHRCART